MFMNTLQSTQKKTHCGLMQVELTGVTGVGKTTLIPIIKTLLAERGILAEESDTAILKFYHLNFIKFPAIRSVLIHFFVFVPYLVHLKQSKGLELLKFCINALKLNISEWAMFLYMLRNCYVQLGINQWLQQMKNYPHQKNLPWDVILVDQGSLQIAHTLFVHPNYSPKSEDIINFRRLVPQPDIAIWIVSDLEKSIQCTLKRGHKRVKSDRASAQAFVESAYQTFETLFSSYEVSAKFLKVDYDSDRSQNSSIDRQVALTIARFLKNHLKPTH
jgi:thymidylate kinase